MVKNKKFHFFGKKFSLGRFSAPVCLGLALLLLAACGETATPQPTATTAPAPTTASPTTSSPTTAPAPTATLGNPVGGSAARATGGATTPGGTALPGIPDEIKKPFALISTDLAKRSNLSPTSFQLTGYSPETFPDSALGCPDPNLMYTQVLTPGYIIEVTAGGQNYDYRSNLAGTHIVLCGSNGRPIPTPKS